MEKRKKGYFGQQWRRDLIFYLCIIAVPSIQFLIFYVGVNANSVLMAFQSYERDPITLKGSYEFLNGDFFGNFKTVLWQLRHDATIGFAFKNSLIAYFVITAVGTTLALVFSMYIYKKMPFFKTFRALLFAPSILSIVITVLMYQNFVENALPSMFSFMDGEGLLTNPDTMFGAVLFFAVWISFGTQILMYSGAMNTIDDSIIEAAKLDGAGAFREFVSIILPLIYPTFVTFMITNLAGLFTNQVNLHAFFGGGAQSNIQTIGYYLYVKTLEGSTTTYAEYPILATYGILLTLVAVPVTLLGRKFLEKIGPKTI